MITCCLEQVYDNEQSLRSSLTKSTPELLPEMPVNGKIFEDSRNELQSKMSLVETTTDLLQS